MDEAVQFDAAVVIEELQRKSAEARERAAAARPGGRVQAHMDGKAAGLKEAADVVRGQVH